MSDHELRFVLNNELHGRPGLPVNAPARITHLAYTVTPTDTDPLVHVSQLFQKFNHNNSNFYTNIAYQEKYTVTIVTIATFLKLNLYEFIIYSIHLR